MEFFRIQRDIPFMRHALIFNIVSLLTVALAVFFRATRGLHFSIEFTGIGSVSPRSRSLIPMARPANPEPITATRLPR